MLEEIEKKIEQLRNKSTEKVIESPTMKKEGVASESTGKAKIVKKRPESTRFEEYLRDLINEHRMVEVYLDEDGEFVVHPIVLIDKWFLLSLIVNAILISIIVAMFAAGIW